MEVLQFLLKKFNNKQSTFGESAVLFTIIMPIFFALPTYRQVFQTGTDIWHICSDISQIRWLNVSLKGAFSAKGDKPLDVRSFPLHFGIGYQDIKVLTDILKHLNCKFWQLRICNKFANVITVTADGMTEGNFLKVFTSQLPEGFLILYVLVLFIVTLRHFVIFERALRG